MHTLVNEQGDWDVMKVNELPPCVSSIILNLPPLNANVDSPIWKGLGDGKFSTSTAYKINSGNLGLEEDWSWLWKLRLPQKLISFLWIVMHGKVLTNQLREQRGLSSGPSCPSCNEVEDMNHLFRTCHKAKVVWLAMFGRPWYIAMIQEPWLDWLVSNSRKKTHFNAQTNWYTIFVVCLWQI